MGHLYDGPFVMVSLSNQIAIDKRQLCLLSVTYLHFSHLADTLTQSNLQVQLGLSALLKRTSTDLSPSRNVDISKPLTHTTPSTVETGI